MERWCNKAKNIPRDILVELYRDQSLGSVKIGKILGVSPRTVTKYLHKYDLIEEASSRKYNKKLNLTKDYLVSEYLKKERSSLEIAKEHGVAKITILRHLKKCGIERRSISKSAKLRMSKSEEREKISGKNHYNWQNGKTKLNFAIRNLYEYRKWRDSIYERDNWTCVECSKRGGKLNVDHIKPFAQILKEEEISSKEDAVNCSKLWNMENGRTLCCKCHKKTDSYGGKYHANY